MSGTPCRPHIQTIYMPGIGDLRVGSVVVRYENVQNPESAIVAVFRDDMLKIRRHRSKTAEHDSSDLDNEELDEVVFRAPGRVIADRLDVIGVDAETVRADLDSLLEYEAEPLDDDDLADYDESERAWIRNEEAILSSMDAQAWVDNLAATPDDSDVFGDREPLSRGWLMKLLQNWDDRLALRAALLAFPEGEVVLDLTANGEYGWPESEPAKLASHAQVAVQEAATTYAPMIVLTEGRTDAEFLRDGLELLYPHLTDLVRFFDYQYKPEGSATALIQTVRAFAAAGIANRVVAVFDNDSAAAEALRNKPELSRLPSNVRIVQYPPVDLAKLYPTLGPPTADEPDGTIAFADVNGLAGSVELYLGRDVLAQADGSLRPIQWTSHMPGVRRYQGKVTGKDAVHDAFRPACPVRTGAGCAKS
jgi:HEPN/Toprim N-terminal domain 1